MTDIRTIYPTFVEFDQFLRILPILRPPARDGRLVSDSTPLKYSN